MASRSACGMPALSGRGVGRGHALHLAANGAKVVVNDIDGDEAQKGGGVAAFVDAEHALDPIYAGNLGVDVGELTARDLLEQVVRTDAHRPELVAVENDAVAAEPLGLVHADVGCGASPGTRRNTVPCHHLMMYITPSAT